MHYLNRLITFTPHYYFLSMKCSPASSVFGMILLFAFVILNTDIAAQKTDILVLDNGDKITGEIKKLNYGILHYKTDDAGTLEVKWDRIRNLISSQTLRFETREGDILVGSLADSASEQHLGIKTGEMVHIMPFREIIRIIPLKSAFWKRLDGSLSIGYDFKKSTSVSTLTYDFHNRYTRTKLMVDVNFSGNYTTQKDKDPSTRQDLNLWARKTMRKKWFYGGYTGYQHNSELGLDLRILVGTGIGKHLVQSNLHLLDLTLGIQGNQEWIRNVQNSTTNLESVVQVNYSLFKYDSPESSINISINISPSLSDWGRLRSDSNITLSQEIVSDFTISLNVYNNFDNRPAEAASNYDWGISTSLGYSW